MRKKKYLRNLDLIKPGDEQKKSLAPVGIEIKKKRFLISKEGDLIDQLDIRRPVVMTRKTEKYLKKPILEIRPKRIIRLLFITSLLIFVILIIFGAYSFIKTKNQIYVEANQAKKNLENAKDALTQMDLNKTINELTQAQFNLQETRNILNQAGQAVFWLPEPLGISSKINSAINIMNIGIDLAEAGKEVSQALNEFSTLNKIKPSEDIYKTLSQQSKMLLEMIEKSQNNFQNALIKVSEANEKLKNIESKDLAAISPDLVTLKEKLPLIEFLLKQTNDFIKVLPSILAKDRQKQYLILFENNAEMRATGGFLGMYGSLKVSNGALDKPFLISSYWLEGKREKITRSDPQYRKWQYYRFQDCNSLIDFLKTAELCSLLYSIVEKNTPDGVIAFTPNLVIDLLKLTGPIDFTQYKLKISAENFRNIMDRKKEFFKRKPGAKYSKEMISDFAPLLLKALVKLPPEQKKEIPKIILKNLTEKHLMFYSKDPQVQQFISNLNWGSEIKKTSDDYLMFYNVNSGGKKSSINIKEQLIYSIRLEKDGSISSRLLLRRQHQGDGKWPDGRNLNYSSFLVPQNSSLIEARGFFNKEGNISTIQSFSHQSFSQGVDLNRLRGWTTVAPGEIKDFYFSWKPSVKIDLSGEIAIYKLLIQKQPGALNHQLNIKITPPEDWEIRSYIPNNGKLIRGKFYYSGLLDSDKYFAIILKRS